MKEEKWVRATPGDKHGLFGGILAKQPSPLVTPASKVEWGVRMRWGLGPLKARGALLGPLIGNQRGRVGEQKGSPNQEPRRQCPHH